MSSATEDRRFKNLALGRTLDRVEIAEFFASTRRHNEIHAQVANGIIPEASLFLPSSSLVHLVRAEITESEAREIIERKQDLVNRLEGYLPDLIAYLHLKDAGNLYSLFCMIDDCHSDFPLVAKSEREDKQRRSAIKKQARAKMVLADALDALEAVRRDFEHTFDQAHRAYTTVAQKRPYSNEDFRELDQRFDQLLTDVRVCVDALALSEHRSKTEPKFLFLTSNRKKTHIVETAHYISSAFCGPPLLTTPGSDFSAFCDLLFEVITGEVGDGLSGAINRFARSQERRKADEDNAYFGPDYEDKVEADNFFSTNEQIAACRNRVVELESLVQPELLPQRTRELAAFMIECETREISRLERVYGPNLVWAHQLPPVDPTVQARSDALNSELIAFDVRIGEIRRLTRTPLTPISAKLIG